MRILTIVEWYMRLKRAQAMRGAILFVIKGEKVWIPKKLIKDHDDKLS